MLDIGKLNPDRVNNGLITKKLVTNACCCILQMVEIRRPIPSTESRYRTVPRINVNGLPENGTSNQSVAMMAINETNESPMKKNGTAFLITNSSGLTGVTMICSSVPTSLSRTTAKDVRFTIITNVSVAMTPGTKDRRLLSPALYQGLRLDHDLKRPPVLLASQVLYQADLIIPRKFLGNLVYISQRNARRV